jgi:hypothetical protein
VQRALAAALFCALPALCAAQADAQVPRPEVKVGDRWVYQRMDYASGEPRGRYELRVVLAERGVIHIVSSRGEAEQRESDLTYTADWNAVSEHGRLYTPHSGWFKFPLRVGARHRAAFEVLNPRTLTSSKAERDVTVVGWEEVTVPAGKFRALKLVSEGRYQRLDHASRVGTSRDVIWYVPEIRRWAKITFETSRSGKGTGGHSGEELVAYGVQ